jgi:hypothetical protein
MNKPTSNLINIITTGIVVTVLFSLFLFWGRFFFWAKLINNMPEYSLRVMIGPSGLVPGEPAPQQVGSSIRSETIRSETMPPGPNEPNFRFSQVYATMDRYAVRSKAIGALWDITAEVLPFHANERVYYFHGSSNYYLCLDKRSGLIISHYKFFEPNDKSTSRETEFFAGPNGISEKAEPSLGRFYDPVVTTGWGPDRTVLYDKKMRRFYVINFDRGSVSKGLQLTEGDSREPIVMGGIEKWSSNPALNVAWGAPELWNAEKGNAPELWKKGKWEEQRLFLPDDAQSGEGYRYLNGNFSHTFIPVLDKTGQIYIYHTKEGSLMPAGYLPVPQSLFKSGQQNGIANPRNVLAYEVVPIYAIQRLPADSNKTTNNFDTKYLGMNVACVSREGTAMAVAVFDPNGKLVYRGDTWINGISTAEHMYYSVSDAPSVTMFLFLLENLQPVTFEAASYLCGDYFEASAGHRALFILPNSFVGMLGRSTDEKLAPRPFVALLLMGPSLILSVWLACKVRKDAVLAGLSGTAKKWWTIGTIAFGLPAYITYRLTRHKEVLVTCQNCGKMRRPDMERCHRCGSKWEMPELTPPNWRMYD